MVGIVNLTSIETRNTSCTSKKGYLPTSLPFIFWTGFYYVAEDSFELMILLPQLAECWNYRCMPPHPGTISLFETAGEGYLVQWFDMWVLRLDTLGLGLFALPFISYFSVSWGQNGGHHICLKMKWNTVSEVLSTEVGTTANTVQGPPHIRYLRGFTSLQYVCLSQHTYPSFLRAFINMECKTVLWEAK